MAGILANKHGITWMTKDGLQKPNYFGSLTQASTCRVGNYKGEEIHVPFNSLLPMVHPNDMVIGGWDISGARTAGRWAVGRVRPGQGRRVCVCVALGTSMQAARSGS